MNTEKKKIFLFLAEGFEETEAVTPADLLRRAGAEVVIVSLTGSRLVRGSHGIALEADCLFEEAGESLKEQAGWYVLPGGMPGTKNLAAHEGLAALLCGAAERGTGIGAICAAPTVPGGLGLLKEVKAACYPGNEEKLDCREISFDEAVADGMVVTSRGAGTAVPFALKLIEVIFGREEAERIAGSIVWRQNTVS